MPGLRLSAFGGALQHILSMGEGSEESPLVVIPGNHFLSILAGRIPGHEIFRQFGRNPSIDVADAPEDIWNGGGEYTGFPLGAAETFEVRSSSTDDTIAGIGARTVSIHNILDGDYNKVDPILVELNGTNWVSLGAQTGIRSTHMDIESAGSVGANVGEITLRHTTTTTNIFSVMPIGMNHSAICAITVPAETAFVYKVKAEIARTGNQAGSAFLTLRVREEGSVFKAKTDPEITTGANFKSDEDLWYIAYAKTDIKLRIESVSANNMIATGRIVGILVDL